MNLFDIIKYKDIDLSNLADLKSLPIDLLDNYYANCSKLYDPGISDYEMKCSFLSVWASVYPEKYFLTFKSVLQEYCNDDI